MKTIFSPHTLVRQAEQADNRNRTATSILTVNIFEVNNDPARFSNTPYQMLGYATLEQTPTFNGSVKDNDTVEDRVPREKFDRKGSFFRHRDWFMHRHVTRHYSIWGSGKQGKEKRNRLRAIVKEKRSLEFEIFKSNRSIHKFFPSVNRVCARWMYPMDDMWVSLFDRARRSISTFVV